MNNIIKRKINDTTSIEEKLKFLDELETDIAFARDIISGKYRYCEECKDYYLKESFIQKR